MKKLKKDDLSKTVKKFLRKKKLKASEYESDFVEKTCALLTTAFNKTYDVSNSALGSIEEQIGKIHEAIFREEAEASHTPVAKPVKKAKKAPSTTTRKTARKAAKKATKKAAKKVGKKTATKRVAKKAAK